MAFKIPANPFLHFGLFILLCVASVLLAILPPDHYFITRGILAAAAALQFNIAVFAALLRIGKLKKKKKESLMQAAVSTGYGVVAGSYLLFILKTAYGMALLLFIAGWGGALICLGLLAMQTQGKKDKDKNAGSAFMIRTGAGAVIYAAVSVGIWFLADWNVSLQHQQYTAQVQSISGKPIVPVGTRCDVDIAVYGERCRVRFFCDGRRLFGKIGSGVLKCKINREGRRFNVRGKDPNPRDGDPAMVVDTVRGTLWFSMLVDGKTPSFRASLKPKPGWF